MPNKTSFSEHLGFVSMAFGVLCCLGSLLARGDVDWFIAGTLWILIARIEQIVTIQLRK